MLTDRSALTVQLAEIVGPDNVAAGDAVNADYGHDECLTVAAVMPSHVVRPASVDEVAAIVRVAVATGTPLTARGSATGLSGGCVPLAGGVVVSFERMARIVEIDDDNHVAVIEPGVTLEALDQALLGHGLVYPVSPGESSASLGGNVATNAGGMRAVKYGVTRHQVLGVQAVLGTGEVIRSGGKFVKATSGYDLSQLIIGSEGTLALVTEVTVRVYPRLANVSTVLAPFETLEHITAAVPRIVGSGVGPMILEYIDLVSMAGITASAGLDLGIPPDVKERAHAYLVVVLEDRSASRLDEDVVELAALISDLGALDVYVLPPQAGHALVAARERAFWAAKANGADDIVDMVVPRAAIATYMRHVSELAGKSGSLVVGCGHVGDGNVHLSIWQGDERARHDLMREVFAAGASLGGAISGEHGIGRAKLQHLTELEDPGKLALMRRIKEAFDPMGILNPGAIFDPEPAP